MSNKNKFVPTYFESLDAMRKTLKLVGCRTSTIQIEWLKSEYIRLIEHYGLRQATKQMKAYYSEAQRYAAGYPVESVTPIWIKRDRGNFPRTLKKHFGASLRGKHDDKIVALSLLRCFESVTLRPQEDLQTVIAGSNGNQNFSKLPSWQRFLDSSLFSDKIKRIFTRKLAGIRTRNNEEGKSLHFTSKGGVMGPSLITAGKQSLSLNEELTEVLITLNNFFQKEGFEEVIRYNMSFERDNKPCDLCIVKSNELDSYLGRIAFIPDKGGKTRLVAIGNYWIQESLLNVHRLVYKILRELPQDGTYNQGSQFERVKRASERGPVWSFDLSAATDRMPIDPQTSVLKSLSEELGGTWREILDMMTFHFKGKDYKYAVGQPMGLYSSWAVFSLTHHFIIQYCAWRVGLKKPFRNYAVLGDDVAIWHKAVARMYRHVMSDVFNVVINESKSWIPLDDTPGVPCIAEFAKRTSYKGHEMTPISPELSRCAWRNVTEIPNLLFWLQNHGHDLGDVPVSRIKQIGKLSSFEFALLVCAIHLRDVIQGAKDEQCSSIDLSNHLPSEVQDVDEVHLHEIRLNLLGEQTFWADHDDPSQNRVALEKAIGTHVEDDHYLMLVMETRKRQVQEVRDSLTINYEQPDPFEWDEHPFPRLHEFEFLPDVEFSEILRGFTARKPKGHYISKFLFKLARIVMRSSVPKGST